MKRSLKNICEKAFERGKTIDLSDCHYGETTGNVFIGRPAKYYYFLSGFVREERLNQILEIGTNSGGSIMSLSKGIPDERIKKSCLVTVDITKKNEKGFCGYPNIIRMHGDSLDKEIIEKTIGSFKAEIDLLYIDSLHEYEHTKSNIEVYSELKPRYIILDDIRQNDEMVKLWKELESKFGEDAIDVSEIIKRHGAGVGVIRYRKIAD